MTYLLKHSTFALAAALSLSTLAHADHKRHEPPPPPDRQDPNTAPEVDPSLALGGLTLLGGTLTVLRSRRSR
jgi:LPXTG-motif cell wall-anchored protein